MFDIFCRFLFRLLGWQVVGNHPTHLSKSIFIVAPHWLWTDFPLGLLTRAAVRMKIGYLGKAELFKPPFGWLFFALGGTPVDRSKNNNLVDDVVKVFNSKETLHVAIAPEGTRKDVDKLKTGFYFMAKESQIPMILIGFDYPNKKVHISDPLFATENSSEDFRQIALFFNEIPGKRKTWINNYLEGRI
jgi:1-acyl-sn-glycerol-3-phosphate acyltransferase